MALALASSLVAAADPATQAGTGSALSLMPEAGSELETSGKLLEQLTGRLPVALALNFTLYYCAVGGVPASVTSGKNYSTVVQPASGWRTSLFYSQSLNLAFFLSAAR